MLGDSVVALAHGVAQRRATPPGQGRSGRDQGEVRARSWRGQERSGEAAAPVLCINVGRVLEEELDDGRVALRRSQVEARAPVVVGRVDRRATAHHVPERVLLALARQLAQLAAGLLLGVEQLAAVLADAVGERPVVVLDRVRQWRAAEAVLRVDARAVREQEVDDRRVALARRQVQARALVVVRGVHVGAARDHQLEPHQLARSRQLAQLRRRLDGRVAQLGALRAQVLGDGVVALADGVAQRRATPPVLGIDLGAGLEQKGGERVQPLRCGQVQARALVVIGGVDGGAALDEQPQLGQQPLPRAVAQRGGDVGLLPAQLRARLAQLVRHGGVAARDGVGEGRLLEGVAAVERHLVLVEQQLDDGELPGRGGEVQEGAPLRIHLVTVDLALGKRLPHHVHLARRGGELRIAQLRNLLLALERVELLDGVERLAVLVVLEARLLVLMDLVERVGEVLREHREVGLLQHEHRRQLHRLDRRLLAQPEEQRELAHGRARLVHDAVRRLLDRARREAARVAPRHRAAAAAVEALA